jgi:hypothetical protein
MTNEAKLAGFLYLLCWVCFILFLLSATPLGRDDSDPQRWGFGGRSNMVLSTDALTGCQYLQGEHGGIIPRVDATGKAGR